MEFIEISAKTVADAVTEACKQLSITSEKLEYEVIDEGKAGILGFGAKPAVIKARVKASLEDNVKAFLNDVFAAMNMEVVVTVEGSDEAAALEAVAKQLTGAAE